MSTLRCLILPFLLGQSRHVFKSRTESENVRHVFDITPYKKGFAPNCQLCLVIRAHSSITVNANGDLCMGENPLDVFAIAVNESGTCINHLISHSAYVSDAGDIYMPIVEGKRDVRTLLSSVIEVGVRSNIPINPLLIYYCF